MRHSTKIALAITAGIALAPGGAMVAPIASPLVMKITEIISSQKSQQIHQTESIEKHQKTNNVNLEQYNQIISTVLGQITQQMIQYRNIRDIEVSESKT